MADPVPPRIEPSRQADPVGTDPHAQASVAMAKAAPWPQAAPPAGEDPSSEAKGLAFLEEIEAKHDRVLTELDALNEHIEKVLEEYLKSRKAPQTNLPEAASSTEASPKAA